MDEDILYRNYLKDVFEPVDEYYYLNLETKEVVPEYMSIVRIDEATLDYVYHYGVLQDIEGNLITEDEVIKVCDCSKGIITYQKPGYIIVMKNLITGEKIYESEYYSLVLDSRDGYNILMIYLGNKDNVYEYAIINPRGEKVFSTKSASKISYSLDIVDDYIRLYQKKKSYIDYKEKIVLAKGYKPKKSSKICSIDVSDYSLELDRLLDRFKLAEEVKKIIKRHFDESNRNAYLRYNDTFLEVLLTGKGDERAFIATWDGNILYNDKIEYFYRWRIESEFNDELIMIPSSLDIHNNISYYDTKGNLISRFVNVSDWVHVDKNIADLYKLGKITNLYEEKEPSGGRWKLSFKIDGKAYETYGEFKCNRLKVRDEKGLIGFIDENGLIGFIDGNGKIIAEPQYYEADDFYYGTAQVKWQDSNSKHIEMINTDGEVLTKNDNDKRKEFDHFYSGIFKMPYILPFPKQLEYTNYKEAKDFWGNDVYYYYDIRDSALRMSKYEPIRQYENYLVYLVKKAIFSESGYYVMDKRTNEKTFLGPLGANTRFCDDYFVIADITYYPLDELINLGHYSLAYKKLKPGVRLVSKEEFIKEKKMASLREDPREKWSLEKRLDFERKKAELIREQKELEALEQQRDLLLAKIKELENKERQLHLLHSLTVPSDFYVELNGYKVINPKYIRELTDYDLLTYDFSNFSLKGVNFKDTNAAINPQKVYNKDISGADLSDVTLLSYDLRDVNIDGTTFTNEFVQTYQESVLKLKRNK